MKPALSQAVAAPLSVTGANGKEWHFSPIRIKGFGELEQWVRSKLIQLGRDAIRGQALSPDERDCIMDAAYRRASMVCLMAANTASGASDEARGVTTTMLSSVDGLVKIVELSLHKKHPNVSAEEVESILDDPNIDAGDLVNEILRISGQGTFRVKEYPGRSIGSSGDPVPNIVQGIRTNTC